MTIHMAHPELLVVVVGCWLFFVICYLCVANMYVCVYVCACVCASMDASVDAILDAILRGGHLICLRGSFSLQLSLFFGVWVCVCLFVFFVEKSCIFVYLCVCVFVCFVSFVCLCFLLRRILCLCVCVFVCVFVCLSHIMN